MSPRLAQPQGGNGAQTNAGNNPASGNRNQAWKNAVPLEQERNEQKVQARLSDACYNDNGGVKAGKVPPNYEVASTADLLRMGLEMSMFSDSDSNFHSVLYRNRTTGQYVLAFRGTNPMSKKDLGNDAAQAFGFDAKQYDEAIALAKQVNKGAQRIGRNVSFTGHSLGGGLAAAASLTTSRPANTFNAAAVSQETLDRNKVVVDPDGDKKLINSFYVPGEIVGDAQAASAAGLGGFLRWITSGRIDPVGVAQGRRIPLEPATSPQSNLEHAAGYATFGLPYAIWSAGKKHLMGDVIDAMK